MIEIRKPRTQALVGADSFQPRRLRYSSTKLRPSGSNCRPRKSSNATPHRVISQLPPSAAPIASYSISNACIAGPKCSPKTSSKEDFQSSRARNLIRPVRSPCERIKIPCLTATPAEKALATVTSYPYASAGAVAKLAESPRMSRWEHRYLGQERFPDALSTMEIEHFFSLSEDELAAVRRRRTVLNRLALALQIGFLKMTGGTLNSVEI